MNAMRFRAFASSRHARGFNLIELMIAMVLGLLVVGGAIGIFASNRQAYRATESLGRMQENARVAFELMAREVREAGGNPCGKNLPVANVLKNSASSWWSNWGNGVVGYNDGALAASAGVTDAIELMSGTSGGVTVNDKTPGSAEIKLSTKDHGLEDFDILMVCDYSQASIFQVTAASGTNITIGHNTGNVKSGPGNCAQELGLPLPPECAAGGKSLKGAAKGYGDNSIVVKLEAARWYVAENGRGRRSLYRMRMDKGVEQPAEEITEGIQNMQIQYLLDGGIDYVDGSAGLKWKDVTAVRIVLDVLGTERIGTDGQPLTRQLAHVVNLRNRVS